MRISYEDRKTILKTRPFNVEELTMRVDDEVFPNPYYRLDCPDWVNVLPLTMDNQVIMIRQPRAGTGKVVLEVPGGVVDSNEKDPTLAAARELEEETGFTSQRILPLGAMNPNPAIQNNVCHFFVALACIPASDRQLYPDPEERITTELVDASTLENMIRCGEINHALCALCIMLGLKYIRTSS